MESHGEPPHRYPTSTDALVNTKPFGVFFLTQTHIFEVFLPNDSIEVEEREREREREREGG